MSSVLRAKTKRHGRAEEAPRERLLDAATGLFTRSGYAATSVREIVADAGVTKPVLYYHFGSKEGIYLTLVQQLLAAFEKRLDTHARRSGNAQERITAMCADLFGLVQEKVGEVRLFYGVCYGPPQSAPSFDFEIFPERFREALAGALRDGAKAHEVDPRLIADATTAIEAMLSIAVETTITQPARDFSKRDLARLIDLLFTGIAPQQRRSSRKEIRR